MEDIEEEVVARFDSEAADPTMFSRIHDGVVSLNRLFGRFPSSTDVYLTMFRPRARVAHLLMSDGGTFLWVHRSIKPDKGTPMNPYGSLLERQTQRKKFAARAEAQIVDHSRKLDKSVNPAISDALPDIEEALSRGVAQALGPAYVCYSAAGPETRMLEKVAA
jgi:hypothetical protein